MCVHPFFSERMVIVTPNTPEYRELDGQMTGQMLRSSFFLAREPGSGTRKRSEEFLRSIGVDPRDLSLAASSRAPRAFYRASKTAWVSRSSRVWPPATMYRWGRFCPLTSTAPCSPGSFTSSTTGTGPTRPPRPCCSRNCPGFSGTSPRGRPPEERKSPNHERQDCRKERTVFCEFCARAVPPAAFSPEHAPLLTGIFCISTGFRRSGPAKRGSRPAGPEFFGIFWRKLGLDNLRCPQYNTFKLF